MRKQRGIAEIFVILIIAGVAVSGIGIAVHSYKSAIERAEAAEDKAETTAQALSDQRAENGRLKGIQEVTDKIAAQRKGADIKKADIERMVQGAIQNVYKQSPEARKWADTMVPPAVLASVRQQTAGNGGGDQNAARPAAAIADKPNAGPGVARGALQRGAAGLITPVRKPPEVVQ